MHWRFDQKSKVAIKIATSAAAPAATANILRSFCLLRPARATKSRRLERERLPCGHVDALAGPANERVAGGVEPGTRREAEMKEAMEFQIVGDGADMRTFITGARASRRVGCRFQRRARAGCAGNSQSWPRHRMCEPTMKPRSRTDQGWHLQLERDGYRQN